MIFTNKNIELEISIVGYEFASYMNEYDDRNWLQVRCCYKNNENIICKEDPSLQTTDLKLLKKWLEDIKDNNIQKTSISFVENTIEFFIKDNKLIVEICFELSIDFKCHQYTLEINHKSIKQFINEIDNYLIKFPERK